MCLVAFQKIFWKIFSGVWKRRRKTQIRKHKATTQEKKSSTITTQDRDHGAIAMAPDRDRRRAIAITGSRWRQIAIDWIFSSRDGAVDGERWDRDGAVGLELELAISDWIFSSRARARSLSLSLFPEVN